MSTEPDKTVIEADKEQNPGYRIRTVEVKKGIAYDVGRTHRTASFGIMLEVCDVASLSSVTTYAEQFCDRRLERTIKDETEMDNVPSSPRRNSPRTSNEPLSFDIEDLNWLQRDGKDGKPPFEMVYVTDDRTRELSGRIADGLSMYEGWTYWNFKDMKAVGRREVV